ncbi:hypothetical protein EPUS_09456 [Endocarpon pusillum Z07020]|uniref:Uncharacterized protein n=1 Tax=Endocarpon pusillum (strain Z07020 / HMAS-L-300199) TaxID=1263415 RepID=U1G8P4_ENDPU|nr:uncharacterized protein EPUS_09456 [Endocarpon pusillum Z07020]ERF68056.1 hypothetical protein EPUS_09456 [Endocarpon pusillum Z07020]
MSLNSRSFNIRLLRNPIIIDNDDNDDNNNSDLTARSNYTLPLMTIDDLVIRCKNTDKDTGGAAHTTIATSGPFSPEIPESDSAATWDEEMQGDPTTSPSGKRSRSLSGSEDDGETEGDGSPSSKRARSSLRPSEVTENQPRPAYDDRSPPGDQEYEVHQVVGEWGSGYEVTALTKIWLPKASVHPKLVRKYRAEQRAATRVQTRRSSRLQNRG